LYFSFVLTAPPPPPLPVVLDALIGKASKAVFPFPPCFPLKQFPPNILPLPEGLHISDFGFRSWALKPGSLLIFCRFLRAPSAFLGSVFLAPYEQNFGFFSAPLLYTHPDGGAGATLPLLEDFSFFRLSFCLSVILCFVSSGTQKLPLTSLAVSSFAVHVIFGPLLVKIPPSSAAPASVDPFFFFCQSFGDLAVFYENLLDLMLISRVREWT